MTTRQQAATHSAGKRRLRPKKPITSMSEVDKSEVDFVDFRSKRDAQLRNAES